MFLSEKPEPDLAVSTPISSAVLPAYYSHKSSGARSGWIDVEDSSGTCSSILWNFGHGLSFTTFNFSNL